jgi:hypothetical protein
MGMTDIERRARKGGAFELTPIAVRIADAIRISGLSRSELYRRAARGQVVLLKCGRSTLVDVKSLHATVAALPRAVIRSASTDD